MSHLAFVQVLVLFLLFAGASLGYGMAIYRLLARHRLAPPVLYSITTAGLAIMLGVGGIANLGLVLALIHHFSPIMIWAVLGGGLLLASQPCIRFFLNMVSATPHLLTEFKKDLLATILLVLALGMLFTLYLSAMQPPIATDELHYHLPQARSIAEQGNLAWATAGTPGFYENIPKLIEVLFAEGLALSGYSLAHSLNYLIMFGFLLFVFGTVRARFGLRSAVFSCLALLLFADFTWNGTVGFIDTATSCFEITALILVTEWIVTKQQMPWLTLAGLSLGLALGAKYSPLPTALILAVSITIVSWRALPRFVIPALLFGGFWYAKNWLTLGNPFYPMYFGHRGMSDASYLEIMNAIWQWEPKTWVTFLHKIGQYITYTGAVTYVSIYLPLLAFFMKKERRWLFLLSGYFFLYLPYWFLLATHQVRFLLTGLIVASIVSGIMLAQLPRKIALLGLLILLGVSFFVRPYPARNLLSHYTWINFHVVERQYALGNISEREFLHREFGCAYDTITFLNDQYNTKDVIDNWTVWAGPSTQYFTHGYHYLRYEDMRQPRDTFGYLYINTQYQAQSRKDPDPFIVEHVVRVEPVEQALLPTATLIYEQDACKLYKL